MDNNNVVARLESPEAYTPRQQLKTCPLLFPAEQCCTRVPWGGFNSCLFVIGMSFGSFFLPSPHFMMCRQQALRHCKAEFYPGYANVGNG